MEGQKYFKTLFKVLERYGKCEMKHKSMINDDDKSKYSSNIKDILESAKNSYEKHCSK